MKKTYIRPAISQASNRKTRTIPDQTLTIKEIVARFTRGIPVDVIQREAVYLDQDEHDFEQLSRMEFGEKANMAEQLRDKAEGIKQQAEANERTRKEAKKQQQAADKAVKLPEQKQADSQSDQQKA